MQVNQTCSQNNFLLFPYMIFLSVLNITLAFNDMKKRNKMLMIARKNSPLCTKITCLKEYLWIALDSRVSINNPSLAIGQVCENGPFSKEGVEKLHSVALPSEPLGLCADTCIDEHVLNVLMGNSALWLVGNGRDLVDLCTDVGSVRMEQELVLAQKIPSNTYIGLINHDLVTVAGPPLNLFLG